MNLPKELTTVTPLSKAIALILFVSLPIIGFIFGMNYQAGAYDNLIKLAPTGEPVACTMEAKICPDGTAVGRTPPSCEFDACPPVDNTDGKTFTGIITDIQYDCVVDGICGISVGKAFVIVDSGEGPAPRVQGSFPRDLINSDKRDQFIGKQVEVYAAMDDGRTDMYTLFGSKEYYVQLVDSDQAGVSCGGIQGKLCPEGYYCRYDGTYPDAGGTCIKEFPKSKSHYTCPETDYVDCMPGPNRDRSSQCNDDFLAWAQNNCPGFQGAAY